jgi:hypothetical protein
MLPKSNVAPSSQQTSLQKLGSRAKRFAISSLSLIAGITLAVVVQAVLGSVFDHL